MPQDCKLSRFRQVARQTIDMLDLSRFRWVVPNIEYPLNRKNAWAEKTATDKHVYSKPLKILENPKGEHHQHRHKN